MTDSRPRAVSQRMCVRVPGHCASIRREVTVRHYVMCKGGTTLAFFFHLRKWMANRMCTKFNFNYDKINFMKVINVRSVPLPMISMLKCCCFFLFNILYYLGYGEIWSTC